MILVHDRKIRGEIEDLVGRRLDEDSLEDAAADLVKLPRDSEWLFSLSVLAEVAAHLQDRDRAAILYGLLLPYARLNASNSGVGGIGSVSRYLGILASTMSRWDDAQSHFEDALAMNERMGARPWLAHTQNDYARVMFDRGGPGDRERAQELLDQALATYREIGMKTYAASARTLALAGG